MDLRKAYLGKYDALFPGTFIPEEEWHTADAFLFEALEATTDLGIDISPFNTFPKSIVTKQNKEVPLTDMYALHMMLVQALEGVPGISSKEAEECAWRLQKHCIRAFGIAWAEYEKFLPKPYSFSDELLKEATQHLQKSVVFDYLHDFPSLAVYTPGEAREVFVDRRFKRTADLLNGKIIDLIPFLAVHEVIEKALYDSVLLPRRAYQSFHQIAQRIEQEAVESYGISWKEYQDDLLEPTILMLADAPYKMLPPGVDLRPVIDAGDMKLAEQLQNAKSSDNSEYANELFEARELLPGLTHLMFKDGARMAETMMRFQEAYESPEFRGQHFTREDFERWFTHEKGGATYVSQWADEGFNVPGTALATFYEGWFNPLTEDEATFLRFFKDRDLRQTYIIVTAESSAMTVLPHEIAHGLYYLKTEYREEVERILQTVDTAPVRKFLSTHPEYASYHEAVLDDEVHAYIGHSLEELAIEGLPVEAYSSAEQKLKELYARYVPNI